MYFCLLDIYTYLTRAARESRFEFHCLMGFTSLIRYMSLLAMPFQNHGHEYETVPTPPSETITISFLLWRLSTRFWNVSVGISSHSVEEQRGLMLDQKAWLPIDITVHPKGVERDRDQSFVWATGVSPHQIHQMFFFGACFVHRGTVMLERERVYCCHKKGAYNSI